MAEQCEILDAASFGIEWDEDCAVCFELSSELYPISEYR